MQKNKSKKLHKNVNINVQCIQFLSLLVLNIPKRVNMPLKSINQ